MNLSELNTETPYFVELEPTKNRITARPIEIELYELLLGSDRVKENTIEFDSNFDDTPLEKYFDVSADNNLYSTVPEYIYVEVEGWEGMDIFEVMDATKSLMRELGIKFVAEMDY